MFAASPKSGKAGRGNTKADLSAMLRYESDMPDDDQLRRAMIKRKWDDGTLDLWEVSMADLEKLAEDEKGEEEDEEGEEEDEESGDEDEESEDEEGEEEDEESGEEDEESEDEESEDEEG